ncbi:hypothetical protein AVEN_207524-1 [Araneus ventricosus]|uniref:Uncharacterized protein n=1 Tax=Araneus ventricosus TaxID=182803 RepID=A0A4Y2NR17_ARAVE|nr:hypothetical protein AVEN_207524-1 [Araneus ventricosus]
MREYERPAEVLMKIHRKWLNPVVHTSVKKNLSNEDLFHFIVDFGMKRQNSYDVTNPAGSSRIDGNPAGSDRIEIGAGLQSLVGDYIPK